MVYFRPAQWLEPVVSPCPSLFRTGVIAEGVRKARCLPLATFSNRTRPLKHI
jgi:hypothetical protein